MDFGKIIRRSWQIVKHHKILWILGMLLGGMGIGGTGSGGNFNRSDLDQLRQKTEVSQSLDALSSFVSRVIAVVDRTPLYIWITLSVILLLVIGIGIIIRIYVNNWAEGAVIGLVNGKENEKEITFREGAKYGIKFAKRLILISIVPSLIYLLFILSLIITIVGSLLISVPVLNIVLPIILGIVLVLFIFLGSLFLALLKTISFRIVVIEDRGCLEAYQQAFMVVKKAFINIIAQGLINYGLGCGFGCLYLIFLVLVIGIIIIGFIINPGIGFSLVTPGIILLILSGVLVGGFNAFKSANWTLFYREIRVKQEDAINGKER